MVLTEKICSRQAIQNDSYKWGLRLPDYYSSCRITCKILVVCSLHIYEDLIPRQTCILTDSWFWPKCCGSDSRDSLPYAVNSQRTTLYQCLTEEYLIACAWNFHQTTCWRRLNIVLQKLTPLKTLLGKDSVPYAGSFCGCLLKKAEYLAREVIHVSYWGR